MRLVRVRPVSSLSLVPLLDDIDWSVQADDPQQSWISQTCLGQLVQMEVQITDMVASIESLGKDIVEIVTSSLHQDNSPRVARA